MEKEARVCGERTALSSDKKVGVVPTAHFVEQPAGWSAGVSRNGEWDPSEARSAGAMRISASHPSRGEPRAVRRGAAGCDL